MANKINIVVVEPSAIIRCGVVTMLQRSELPDLEIVEFSDVSSILSGGYNISPDVVIINASLVGFYSLSQLRSDIGGGDELKVVAIQSTFIEQSRMQSYDEVISIYDSIESIKDKIKGVISTQGDTEGKKELSQREREIIVCVVKGMTNKQIADTLCISTHTVIAHRRNISNKLQIHSPSGLTIFAIVNKLVDLADIKNSISKGSTTQTPE